MFAIVARLDGSHWAVVALHAAIQRGQKTIRSVTACEVYIF